LKQPKNLNTVILYVYLEVLTEDQP